MLDDGRDMAASIATENRRRHEAELEAERIEWAWDDLRETLMAAQTAIAQAREAFERLPKR